MKAGEMCKKRMLEKNRKNERKAGLRKADNATEKGGAGRTQ